MPQRYLPRRGYESGKCRFCGKKLPLSNKIACSRKCWHEYNLRSSRTYMRRFVFKRDRGICAVCGLDTHILKKEGRQILKNHGREAYWNFASSIQMPPEMKCWYVIDHIIRVEDGGGSCSLDNLRTLCYPCDEKNKKILKKT